MTTELVLFLKEFCYALLEGPFVGLFSLLQHGLLFMSFIATRNKNTFIISNFNSMPVSSLYMYESN